MQEEHGHDEKGPYCTIICRLGEEVKVDPHWFIELSAREWKLDNAGYPKATVYGVTQRMHNVIRPPRPGYDVDHRDENKLDNRECNLEYLTKEEHTLKSMRTRAERKSLQAVGFGQKEVLKQIKREVSGAWQGISQEELRKLISEVQGGVEDEA